MKATIYLDIDGVLNKHRAYPNGYNGIDYENLQILDRVLEGRNIEIVLSSAWRYLIHNGSMTLTGFQNLLKTHGMHNTENIVWFTREDAYKNEPRAIQIQEDIDYNQIKNYLIIDDLDLGFTENNMNFLWIDPTKGLEERHYDMILKRLKQRLYDKV